MQNRNERKTSDRRRIMETDEKPRKSGKVPGAGNEVYASAERSI